MITYHYRCTNCAAEFETGQSIKAKPLSFCSACQSEALERVIHAVHFSLDPGVTTIGKLAEVNSKKMGKEQRQKKQEQILAEKDANANVPEAFKKKIRESGGKIQKNEKKDDAWYWKGVNKKATVDKIGKMTKEQKKRYIQEGK